jgi:glutathione synthase/RimK-type ligase-like ATP-grasp enzyme
MKFIAIQPAGGGFDQYWIEFCKSMNIPYKIVDCYKNDIIDQLLDCKCLMWQFYQNDPKANKFARQLLFTIQTSGKKVFPDINTMWHFDDKVGQKYLLESIGAPTVQTWVFYDRNEALQWAAQTSYPKVFKLRSGAGSANVKLVRTRIEANKLIHRAFGKGFSQFDAWTGLEERWRKFRLGKSGYTDVLKGVARIFYPTGFSRLAGKEKGYVYFQEFIPGNEFDIRVIVVGRKAFAIKRMVRKGDFRASGSGHILYDKTHFDNATVELAFRTSEKLKTQCIAYDFVYQGNKPLIVEISYGFSPSGYLDCPGYWDDCLNWYEGKFNPYGWMVEMMLKD